MYWLITEDPKVQGLQISLDLQVQYSHQGAWIFSLTPICVPCASFIPSLSSPPGHSVSFTDASSALSITLLDFILFGKSLELSPSETRG